MIGSLASNFALKGCAVALRARQAHVNLPNVTVLKICGIMSTQSPLWANPSRFSSTWLPESPTRKLGEFE